MSEAVTMLTNVHSMIFVDISLISKVLTVVVLVYSIESDRSLTVYDDDRIVELWRERSIFSLAVVMSTLLSFRLGYFAARVSSTDLLMFVHQVCTHRKH